jgi:type IV pilus assembly protein PilC
VALVRFFKLLLIATAALLGLVLLIVCIAMIVQTPQTGFAIGIPVTVLALLCWMIWSMIQASIRRRRGAAILGYLEQAVRMNLPLPRLVGALGDSERGRMARDLQEAKLRLEQGGSIVSVLEALPKMPSRVLGLVAAAERSGRLPQVLSKLMEQRRRSITRGLGFLPFYRTYPLILGLVFICVTTIIMVFVMPKFESIFKDFHIELPAVTVAMLELCRVAWPWVPLLVAILLIAMIVNTITSGWWIGGGYGLVERPIARLVSFIPWFGRMQMDRALGDVLDCAADTIEAGRPIESSLSEAGHVCGNSRLRQRIDRWAANLSQGQPLPYAARDAGMPPLVSGMLSTGMQTPDIAQVFRFLGRYYSTRFSRAIALIEASAAPVIAISIGIMVAWLALTIFAPMISLIQTLSSPAPRSL